MLTFIQLLIETHSVDPSNQRSRNSGLRRRKSIQYHATKDDDGIEMDDDVPLIGKEPINLSDNDAGGSQALPSCAMKRWQLYYTLVRNPQLIKYRKSRATWCEKKQKLTIRPRGRSIRQQTLAFEQPGWMNQPVSRVNSTGSPFGVHSPSPADPENHNPENKVRLSQQGSALSSNLQRISSATVSEV